MIALIATLILGILPGGGQDLAGTFSHGGLEREYYLHLPPDYSRDKPHPLVFVLHGGGGLAKFHNEKCTGSTLNQEADRLGMILVYPQGWKKRWQDGREFLRKEARKDGDDPAPDDVDFLVQLLQKLHTILNIDSKAVFATGISNGGFMSLRLAQDRADLFAAVAPVTASLIEETRDRKPSQPISVAFINGTEDPLVPYEGGSISFGRLSRKSRGEILSTSESVRLFQEWNGCEKAMEPTFLPDQDPDDGTRVKKTVLSGGKQGTSVVLFSVEGGGHTWPGGSAYARERLIGKVSRDLQASREILEFFLAHRRP